MRRILFALVCVLFVAGCNQKKLPVFPEEEQVHSISEDESIEYCEATLYFPDEEAMYLVPESRQLRADLNDTQKAGEILKMLFDGPRTDNLYPSLKGDCRINSVVICDGTCTVDFSADFVLNNIGGSAQESFAIGSVVKSLCGLESVERVKINIDGEENAEFGGHFMLDAPFSENTFSYVTQ